MVAAVLAQDVEDDVVVEPLTRQWYDLLVDKGHLESVPVELLDGEMIRMAPQGWPHSRLTHQLTQRLDRALHAAHPDAYEVLQEKPFAAGVYSEPEADIAVVDADQVAHGTGHPSSAHLVVEIAESSRRIDLQRKPPVYAGAGVPLYWVVDITRGEVVVHSIPSPSRRRITTRSRSCRGRASSQCWGSPCGCRPS